MANKGKFYNYLTDMMLYEREKANIDWTVQSEFRSCGYISRGNSVVVLAGKNGILAMDLDAVDDFCAELQEIKELFIERKCMGLKGVYRSV